MFAVRQELERSNFRIQFFTFWEARDRDQRRKRMLQKRCVSGWSDVGIVAGRISLAGTPMIHPTAPSCRRARPDGTAADGRVFPADDRVLPVR